MFPQTSLSEREFVLEARSERRGRSRRRSEVSSCFASRARLVSGFPSRRTPRKLERLSAEVPSGEHLRVDLEEPRGDRQGRRVVHLLSASPNRVILQRTDKLHLRQRGLASRLRSRSCHEEKGGGARSVWARRHRGTGVGTRKTNAAARWRRVKCWTSTDAETHPGLLEGFAFAAVHRGEDATRDRVARRTKKWRARGSSIIPRGARYFHPMIVAVHTSLRVCAPTGWRGRCSRRRWRAR